MRKLLVSLAPALHLTRITTAFAAVGNVWFIILWTRGVPEEPGLDQMEQGPLWMVLGAGALNALGLFVFATSLNDVLDWRRDRALNPHRPIPSGRISVDAAVALVVGSLICAVVGAAALGMPAVLLTVLVAGAILALNGAAKYVPAVGFVLLGLIYAGQMVVPNLALRFVWPVWLVMTHALLTAGAAHLIGKRRPPVSRRAAFAAAFGWAFWSGVMFATAAAWSDNTAPGPGEARTVSVGGGVWPDWVPLGSAIAPAVLAAIFVFMAWRKVRTLGPGPRAAEKIHRYGALWLSLYGTAWMLGQGLVPGAAILGGLSLAGFLGMTVLRELFSLIEQPLVYKR